MQRAPCLLFANSGRSGEGNGKKNERGWPLISLETKTTVQAFFVFFSIFKKFFFHSRLFFVFIVMFILFIRLHRYNNARRHSRGRFASAHPAPFSAFIRPGDPVPFIYFFLGPCIFTIENRIPVIVFFLSLSFFFFANLCTVAVSISILISDIANTVVF